MVAKKESNRSYKKHAVCGLSSGDKQRITGIGFFGIFLCECVTKI